MPEENFDITDWRWWTLGGGAVLALVAILKGFIRLPREVTELERQLKEEKEENAKLRVECHEKETEIRRWIEFAARSVEKAEKGVEVVKAITDHSPPARKKP